MRREESRIAMTDREVVEAFLKTRSEEEFRELYRRHTPKLYRFVLRLLGGEPAQAEEVVHDAWIRAVQRLSGFRWESNLGTWLGGIALNRCREVRRSSDLSGLQARRDLRRPEPAASGSPDGRLDLENAIAALPEGYRRVLVLHDLEGYSHAEIAGALGIEIGTSKSQLFEARRRMRRLLAGAAERSGG